jgi:hypothetical protein
MYRVSQKKLTPLLFIWISNVSGFFDSPFTGWVKKNWHLCYSFEYQMYQFFFTHPV